MSGAARTHLRRIAREPLLHFLLLGAALTGSYGWLHREAFDSPNEIVVSRGQLTNLDAQFERLWRRPPTPQELQGLLDNWVREEIFYREGLVMGLDRDDPVVRRRIGQKIEFILDSGIPPAPTPGELQAWLVGHPDAYRIEPQYSLTQIYFEPQTHRERLAADLAGARGALDRGETIGGDSTLLPSTVNASASEVQRVFGGEFERALRDMPLDVWYGPVRSGFGVHLVALHAREPARAATLDEVRAAVERDFSRARAQESADAFYARLRATYRVRVEEPADAGPPG